MPSTVAFGTRIGDDMLQRWGWTLAASAPTTHFTYPAGFALAPGTTIQLTDRSIGCGAWVNIYVYLTAD
jgi:hypothetical protein